MGGVCYVAATIDRPGVIRQTGAMQRLMFGEHDGSRSARAGTFLAACRAGGVNGELAADVRREIRQKFVFLAGLSGCTATIRWPIGPIRTNPRTRAFFLDVMREVVAVGRAQGVPTPLNRAIADIPELHADGRAASWNMSRATPIPSNDRRRLARRAAREVVRDRPLDGVRRLAEPRPEVGAGEFRGRRARAGVASLAPGRARARRSAGPAQRTSTTGGGAYVPSSTAPSPR
jgi:hypothetical protein